MYILLTIDRMDFSIVYLANSHKMSWIVSEIPNIKMLFLIKLARNGQLSDLTKGTTISECPQRNNFYINEVETL